MAESLQLRDPANWGQVYDLNRQATPYGANGFIPIPRFEVPIVFHSPILSIAAVNSYAYGWWRLGCRVRQLFDVPQTVEIGSFERMVLINRGGTLVQFPRYADQYRLEINVPHWHREIRLTIWEYIGPITDTTAQLVAEQTELIRIDLLRIETKIDALQL